MKKFLKTLSVLLGMVLTLGLTACEEDSYTVEQLIGTWSLDSEAGYLVTFNTNGSLEYTAPGNPTQYPTTFNLDGKRIFIRVSIANSYVEDVVEIRSLSESKLVIYYDGELLFDNQSLKKEYSLSRKK